KKFCILGRKTSPNARSGLKEKFALHSQNAFCLKKKEFFMQKANSHKIGGLFCLLDHLKKNKRNAF
ncbi:MAG: hypothetical protein V4507_06970, partial [Verrucomicrobiota bacterium]